MGYSSESSEMSCSSLPTPHSCGGKVRSPERKKWKCSYDGCTATFNRRWKLEGHICRHTNERPFKCTFDGCIKAYTTNSHLQRHIQASHTGRLTTQRLYIPCPVKSCLKFCSTNQSLKKHVKTHDKEKSYECVECKVEFKKHHQLTTHNIMHTGVFPFVCDICHEGFPRNIYLEKHKRKHQKYACEYPDCNVVLDNWTLFRKHIKVYHPPVYNCNECNRTFHHKGNLRNHVLSHLTLPERKVFSCHFKDCSRRYSNKRNLTQHILSFHRNRRYKCSHETCNMSLSTKQKLINHMKLHDPEKKIVLYPKKENRRARKDIGIPRKSMAARLSGLVPPSNVDKLMAQDRIPPEVMEEIQENIVAQEFNNSDVDEDAKSMNNYKKERDDEDGQNEVYQTLKSSVLVIDSISTKIFPY